MSRARASFVAAVLASLAFGAAVMASQQTSVPFPHETHERLFPVCEGCHAGILNGNAEALYPGPADCAQCHDGTRVKQVAWQVPGPRPSNLRFSHTSHRQATDSLGGAPACQSCHTVHAEARRMSVGAPQPTRCLECHAHRSSEHLSPTADCSRCHVPIAAAPRVPQSRVANFPRPPWHDSTEFATMHGRDQGPRATSCAVCHARETCERCHANATAIPFIAGLARDARIATLERGRAPSYPVPATHNDGSWSEGHGADARTAPASCANCHTRPGCLGCHRDGTGSAGSTIASLPGITGTAVGVSAELMAHTPHSADIAQRHGALAATGKPECAQCHAPRFCAACHAGSDSRAFHDANYVERHAVDVFAARADCQTCHNTERFCRDCHAKTGVAAASRMNAAFHNGQAGWVLSHGQAARAGLESCVSCHRQNDCMRCHSAAGGWGVNPHGPGFAASRLAARTTPTCRLCHLGKPGGGP